jgi:hypothetical protein
MSDGGSPATSGVAKSISDLVEDIISQWTKFFAFIGLAASVVGLILLLVWIVPKLLHLTASQLTISSKGSEIQLKSSGANQDEYYLVVNPQTSWQPTHVFLNKGAKVNIVADGRVNVDFYGLWQQITKRISKESDMEKLHPGLRENPDHTPEEYFSDKDWQELIPRHYWSGPEGDNVFAPTSFKGRQKYKIARDMSYGALIGTILKHEDVDSDGEPPRENYSIFKVGAKWPDPNKDEGAPATGWLWLAVNDVVEPESAFPNAKGVRLSDVFLLDNLGMYRVVITIPH